MEVKFEGNPGQDNTYSETHLNGLQNYAPNAQTVNNYNYGGGLSASTRMSNYFQQLHREIEDKTKRQIIDELLYYTTKLDGTKGMEEKLKDGGFSNSFIRAALRQKQQYAKKAMQFDCYPSAQEINLLLFTDVINAFRVYIEPMIHREEPIETVMERIHEKVVSPIMAKINENGAEDQDLHYTTDHIYGMIYYLTGMCHLNWKDYDNI